MQTTRINPAHLVSIYSSGTKLSKQYAWNEEKSAYFHVSAFYRDYPLDNEERWSIEGLMEIEPKMGLYTIPSITINMVSGNNITKTFKTENEAEKFIETHFGGVNLIRIEL